MPEDPDRLYQEASAALDAAVAATGAERQRLIDLAVHLWRRARQASPSEPPSAPDGD